MSTRLEPLDANPNTVGVTEQVAREALWHIDRDLPGAVKPSGFRVHLWCALGVADDNNLRRLSLGYGPMVRAYKLATRDPQGLAILRGIIDRAGRENVAGTAWAPEVGESA